MIEQRFLRYAKQASFTYDLEHELIMLDSIAFIDDTMRIWTHGKYYQGFEGYDVNKMLGLLEAGNLQIKQWYTEVDPTSEEWDIVNQDTVQHALKKVETRLKTEVNDINSRVLTVDEEDLTQVNNVVSLKSYDLDPLQFHRYGRKIIKKNLLSLGALNILTQALVNELNTLYEIKYDFDLNGYTITLPLGSSLFFNGGSLSNGKIVGNNSYIYGYVTQSKYTLGDALPVGYSSEVSFENCYNMDGTLFTSKTFGETRQRPRNEINGFTFYDTTINKLIVWDSVNNDWLDVFGNSASAVNYGSSPASVKSLTKPGFLYKDKSSYWQGLTGSHSSRWLVRNDEGDWDVLANTDVATITLDGLMSADDKIWLEGEEGHPENGAKERLNTLEAEVNAIREDFLTSATFLQNASFTNLLDSWETLKRKYETVEGIIESLVIHQEGTNAKLKDIEGWIIPESIITDMNRYIYDTSYSQQLTKNECNTILGNSKIRPESNISIQEGICGQIYNQLGPSKTFNGTVDDSGMIYCATADYSGVQLPAELIPDNFNQESMDGIDINLSNADINNLFGLTLISEDVKGVIHNTALYHTEKYNWLNKETGEIEEREVTFFDGIKHTLKFTVGYTVIHRFKVNISRGGKRFFTFGQKTNIAFGKMYGRFIQCDKDSLKALLSDHRGSTYAITKDARSSVCIDNNFIRQNRESYVLPPVMEQAPNGLYIPVACDLNFYYYVERGGTLEIYFEDETKSAMEDNVTSKQYSVYHYKETLNVTDGWKQFNSSFNWNGYGNFTIKFTGKIYIHTITANRNQSLQLQHNYEDLQTYTKGVSARFDGFDNSYDPADKAIEDSNDEFVKSKAVVYIPNIKLFVGVYDGADGQEHYTSVWDTVDMYNDRSDVNNVTIYKDKIFICGDKLYIYDPYINSLKKYSSDNNDHLINVDEQGFYIVDQNGYIAFKVDAEGVEYAKDAADNPAITTLQQTVNTLMLQIEAMQEEIENLKDTSAEDLPNIVDVTEEEYSQLQTIDQNTIYAISK